MIKNIGKGQNRIGNDGKIEEKDKSQRQSKRKKKLNKKTWKLESEQKKARKKWATWLTHITSCKTPWGEES